MLVSASASLLSTFTEISLCILSVEFGTKSRFNFTILILCIPFITFTCVLFSNWQLSYPIQIKYAWRLFRTKLFFRKSTENWIKQRLFHSEYSSNKVNLKQKIVFFKNINKNKNCRIMHNLPGNFRYMNTETKHLSLL